MQHKYSVINFYLTKLILIWTCNTAMAFAVTKSLCFKTFAPICLTLFLAFAAVTTEKSLTTSGCRFESLPKCDFMFCVDIRNIQKLLRTQVKLISGLSCNQKPSFHCNFVHVMLIPIEHNSKNVSWVTSTFINYRNWNSNIVTNFSHL